MRHVRLLLADDDAALRGWLREALERRGASVTEAASGWELLLRLAEDPAYDLVVSDLRMPMPNGIAVVAMARAAGITVPFILITAFADDISRRRVDALDRAVLIDKPLDVGELVACAVLLLGSGRRASS